MLKRKGVTLTELMIAVSVLTIGVIGSMGAFSFINKAMTQSRIKTIATNLAQEKMEVLKNKSYFQLLITTASADSSGYSPNFVYDTDNYPPETITLWGFPALTRRVNVDYVSVTSTGATVLPYTSNDPGMKKISVYVTWSDAGNLKKVQLDSYYENPAAAALSAGFTGKVYNKAIGVTAPIGNALVQVMGAPKWRGYSDPATGIYTFQVAPGTYTLVCSTQGYFSYPTSTLYVNSGAYTTQDFPLTKIDTGSVSGMAYIRDHLVISQVVVSTVMASGVDIEYVELYNPTTWTINVGHNDVKLRYLAENSNNNVDEIMLSGSFSIAPGKYGLITNSYPLNVGGATPIPDAQFGSIAANPKCNLHGLTTNCLRENETGAVQIYDNSKIIDTVGWTRGSLTVPAYEGTPVSEFIWWGGFPAGYQLRRNSEGGHLTSGVGQAYDANINNSDFVFIVLTDPYFAPPHSTLNGVFPPATGTPAAGAVVTVDDGISASALVSATGYYFLTNIATSTVQGSTNSWTVTVDSYTLLSSSAGITVPANKNKDLATIILGTACTGGIATGYVFGAGPDYNRRLGTPSIKVGNNGVTANTDSQGFYMLFLPTGTVTITANYGSANGNYQASDVDVTLAAGTVVQVPDFHISQGGYLTGYVTSGTGALPNVVVQASLGSSVYEDTSDSTGRFYIYATTSSLAYTIAPVLDMSQSYTAQPTAPLVSSVTVPGSTVFAGTITVTGALGNIYGTVTSNSKSITTGVLVVASTITVTDPLPAVVASSAPALTVLYSVSSQADGTYSLDVRSSTYSVRAFYPVVDSTTGSVSYTSKVISGVFVNAGSSVKKDFSWP